VITVRRMSRWKTLIIDMGEKQEVKRWKALVEYYKTGDILLLQQRLGHKNVRSTLAYLERSRPLLKLLGEAEKIGGLNAYVVL
jgi:hypothetical protein